MTERDPQTGIGIAVSWRAFVGCAVAGKEVEGSFLVHVVRLLSLLPLLPYVTAFSHEICTFTNIDSFHAAFKIHLFPT